MRLKRSFCVIKGIVLFFNLCVAISVGSLPSVSIAGSDRPGKLTIYVVNYPLKYFAERIAGDHATVVFPAPSEADPAYWIPDVPTIAKYQQADLILLNGAGYAGWVNMVSLPRSKMVNTSSKFKDQYIRIKGAVTHSHGPGVKHGHEGIAFTTWLDFDLATRQARAVAAALSRKRPMLKDSFQNNYKAIERDLLAIDQDIKAIVSRDQSRPFIGSHPVYDYLARRYKLNMESVHWEPDEIPNLEQWTELQRIRKKHSAKWMIWEGEPLKESVEKLQGIGVRSLVFDPCGNVPEQEDFIDVIRQNIISLDTAFK